MTQLPELGIQWEPLLRMLVALLLGAAVGWEREMQRQPAGFRTHALVGLGAAIFTVVSALHTPRSTPKWSALTGSPRHIRFVTSDLGINADHYPNGQPVTLRPCRLT